MKICTIDDYRVAEVYNRASQCLSLCLSIPALYTLTRVRMIIFVDDDDDDGDGDDAVHGDDDDAVPAMVIGVMMTNTDKSFLLAKLCQVF